MKKKLLCTLVSLFIVIVGYQLVTGASGRESTKLPPQEVQIMYSTEDHAYQQKDLNNVVRFKTLPDGDVVIYNSSGMTTWGVDSTTGSGVTGTFQAILGGTTAHIAWSGRGTAATGSAAGNSGWHLTTANLRTYREFLVETSEIKGGCSWYTEKVPVSVGGKLGATVYLTGCLDPTIHGMTWKFTKFSGGATPFVLYDGTGRFLLPNSNSFTGTTESPVTATNRAPEDLGDTVEVRAIYYPIGASGWYVTNIWNYD